MRLQKLWNQLAENRALKVNGIIRKTEYKWPVCQKCNEPVDYCGIEDRGPDPDLPKWFEIRVKHHGEEDFGRVELEVGLPPENWSIVMGTFPAFDPKRTDERQK